MLVQNDIIGRNHVRYGNGFACSRCLLWVDGGEDELDRYMKCSKLGLLDYKIKDGSCPYSYNQYKLINKK